MTHKVATYTAALLAAVFFFPLLARAYDIRHPHPQDLTPALQKSLTDKVSDEAGPYLDQEDEKHNQGKNYVDLQQKFEYLPTHGPGGTLTCSVKLGGPEYNPNDKKTAKGAPTGVLKYLVFSYAYHNHDWVEIAKPKWESQDLGPKGRAQMTAGMQRAEKGQAARQKAMQAHAAAAAAAASAQKAANGGQ